jgi:hypothetical protein
MTPPRLTPNPMKSRRTCKLAWRLQATILRGHTTVDALVKASGLQARVSGVRVGSSQHRLAAQIALTTSHRELDRLVCEGEIGNSWEPEEDE